MYAQIQPAESIFVCMYRVSEQTTLHWRTNKGMHKRPFLIPSHTVSVLVLELKAFQTSVPISHLEGAHLGGVLMQVPKATYSGVSILRGE